MVASPTRQSGTQKARAIESETFEWTKQWYPMVPLNLLEESQGEGFASGMPEIQKMCILGRNIVVWKDLEGVWRAVEDRCAHRLAALSLGSVQKDGTLACRYHGWCFNGRGECIHIPQAPDDVSEATACSSSRSKVKAFPTCEAAGLLWIWPDDSSSAWEDSAAKGPTLGSESDANTTWLNVLDLPMSYSSQMENSFDPTHILYVHNGQRGFSPGQRITSDIGRPMTYFRQVGSMSADGGFELKYPPYKTIDEWKEATLRFHPPSTITFEGAFSDGSRSRFHINNVPTKPGHVRLILSGYTGPTPRKPELGSLGLGALFGKLAAAAAAVGALPVKLALKLLPQYLIIGLMHTKVTISANQDVVTLHSEDLALARSRGFSNGRMFLPTPSDHGVSTWSSWLRKFGNGGPPWYCGGNDAEAVQMLTYSELFDTWKNHSKSCPSCCKSLKFLGRAEAFLSRAALAFMVAAVMLTAVRTTDVRIAIAATIAMGVTILMRFQIQQFRQKFLTGVSSTGVPEVSFEWPS